MPEPAFVRRVEAVSVADRVTSEIRRAILAGRLRPGQEFSLRQIASQLGVSFIPVREALRSLEAEGLLITRRGRSATVAPLDPDELHSICELRRRIEPELAARACVLTTGAELDALNTQIAHQPDPHSHPDECYDAHRNLLLDLLRPAATNWDLRMLQMLWRATERYLRIGFDLLDRTASDADRFDSAQRDLLAGYRTQDSDQARSAMLRHVDWNERIADRGLAAAS